MPLTKFHKHHWSCYVPNKTGHGSWHIAFDNMCQDGECFACMWMQCAKHVVHITQLPHGTKWLALLSAGKHMLRCQPQALALNSNASRMSVIDLHGVLSFYDFQSAPQQAGAAAQSPRMPVSGEHLSVERKVSPNSALLFVRHMIPLTEPSFRLLVFIG